jgi:hypothetical protein
VVHVANRARILATPRELEHPNSDENVCSYEIKAGEIRILVFSSMPIVRIPISNVAQVTHPSPRQLWLNPLYALRLGNRLFGGAVLIRKRRGLIKSIIITPDDPAQFIDQCNSAKQ